MSENIFKIFQKAYMLQKPTAIPAKAIMPQKTKYVQVKNEPHFSEKSYRRVERKKVEQIFNDYFNLFLLRFWEGRQPSWKHLLYKFKKIKVH